MHASWFLKNKLKAVFGEDIDHGSKHMPGPDGVVDRIKNR